MIASPMLVLSRPMPTIDLASPYRRPTADAPTHLFAEGAEHYIGAATAAWDPLR
jgi:hypothetical protein